MGMLLVEALLGVPCRLRGCGTGTSKVGLAVVLLEELVGDTRDCEV